MHIEGTIDNPSVHEAYYKPSYKPEKIKHDYVHILEDKRGGPGFEQMYHHYKPIEPGVPKDTIFAKWMELEGPFYDEKSIFEQLVERYKVKTAKDHKLDAIAEEFLSEFSQEAFRQKAFHQNLFRVYTPTIKTKEKPDWALKRPSSIHWR